MESVFLRSLSLFQLFHILMYWVLMLVHLKTYKTFNWYVKNFGFSGKTKYQGHVLCIEILI